MRRPNSRSKTSERGNVAMLTALLVTPIVGCVGLAVDSGGALRQREQLQYAVDAGVLAALKALPTQDDAGVRAAAQRYVQANFSYEASFELSEVKIDRSASRVELEATSAYQTAFGRLFGVPKMDIRVDAVGAGGGTIELVMALDNSGSMAEAGRIEALREASTDLVDSLMADPDASERIRIGVAPFSTAVNVGPANSNASWIDRTGANPLNGQNVQGGDHHLGLFNKLDVAWKGCVEARTTQSNLDVSDAAPSGGGRTLFVPMFAPDEPDLNGYGNSYLKDDKGVCRRESDNSPDARQTRACKYVDQKPKVVERPWWKATGPNAKCESSPVLPLTNDKAAIIDKLKGMTPEGNTNIVEGATWGWRLLSPGAPFTEGKPYRTAGNRKILIVMTDGENTMSGTTANHNMSAYSAYGFSANKRLLKQATGDEPQIRAAMNDRLRLACANAKAAGVEVYSILLSVPTAEAREVMEDCATEGGATQHAYSVATAGELKGVFQEIGSSIKSVRLAE